MKKRTILTIGLAALLTAGFGSAQAGHSSKLKAAYEKELAHAKALVEKAASVEGEWRDIRWKKSKKKFLPSAIAAAKAGDYKKAMKLLKIVEFQAEMGYKQAMAQKNAGPQNYGF